MHASQGPAGTLMDGLANAIKDQRFGVPSPRRQLDQF
jgi:hypothetical protein